jgi:hypothetical protein
MLLVPSVGTIVPVSPASLMAPREKSETVPSGAMILVTLASPVVFIVTSPPLDWTSPMFSGPSLLM